MFISKKKLEKMIQEVKEETAEKIYKDISNQRTFDELNRRIYELETHMCEINDAIQRKGCSRKKTLNE